MAGSGSSHARLIPAIRGAGGPDMQLLCGLPPKLKGGWLQRPHRTAAGHQRSLLTVG